MLSQVSSEEYARYECLFLFKGSKRFDRDIYRASQVFLG
jgi:hypothetical protein